MYLPVTQYYSPNVILVVAFKYGTPLAESFSKVPKNLLDRLSHNFKMEKFEINEIKLYYRERNPESRPPDPLSQAAENRSECIFPFPK